MKWMKEHDVILRVFALLLAAMLWVYVMSARNTDKTVEYRNIPVQLDGLDQLAQNNLVILSGSNNTVSVKVTGAFNSVLDMSEEYITATASVGSIIEPGTYSLNYRVVVDASGVTLAQKSPSKIEIVVDSMSAVSVPVEVEFTGTLPEGLTISDYSVSPDAIVVRGAESILKQIRKARVVYDVSGLTRTTQTSVRYTLLDAQDNEITDVHVAADLPSTMLALTVKQKGTIPLTVRFANGEHITERMINYRIEPEEIMLMGDPDAIAVLNQIELGTIDLQELEDEGTIVYTMPVMLPNGVLSEEALPAEATVTLTLNGYAFREMTVSQSRIREDGLLTYPEQTVTFRVFGPESAVSRLKESDFTLTPEYDLMSLTAGENTLTCAVESDIRTLYIYPGAEIVAQVSEEALAAARNAAPSNQPPSEP
ncbi:MAG: hypothetical protein IJT76_08145 [Clostridia bacterium]|nr:hypothetical protein [Clostridia bacterium]